jgi:hypothetical protein
MPNSNDSVDVVFSHYSGDDKPGDRKTVTAAEAKRLAKGGIAKPANATAAKKVGVDPENPTVTTQKGV